ncbi:MAG: hypothetical protein ABJQ53_08665 [Roseibium sp.]
MATDPDAHQRSNSWFLRISAGVALMFGVMTVISGGTVLFSGSKMQALAGDTVSFVLWFNFLSGFIYVLVGVGIAQQRRWATKLSIALAVAIAIVFLAFGFHILQGGAFEVRTVAALTLRLAIWVVISAVLLTSKRAR